MKKLNDFYAIKGRKVKLSDWFIYLCSRRPPYVWEPQSMLGYRSIFKQVSVLKNVNIIILIIQAECLSYLETH